MMTKTNKQQKIYKRTHRGLKSIGKFAQDIGRNSFKKQGFNGLEMFKQWPFIVGNHLSQYCLPEKINWPRGSQKSWGNDLSYDQTPSATLVIKCLGAFALEIESNAPSIIQNANMIFGYSAIGKIKIKQSQTLILEQKPAEIVKPKPNQKVLDATHDIKDNRLREALDSLGAQVYNGKSQKGDL